MTVNDLKIGSQIIFGKYSAANGRPQPPDIIWLKASKANDFITQKVVDWLCYDAGEPMNSYGNPNYLLSNIRQFLNSKQDGRFWYNPTHEYDISPSSSSVPYPYEDHKGFLYYFEDYEIDSIEPVDLGDGKFLSVRLPACDDLFNETKFELFKRRGVRTSATSDLTCAKWRADNNGYVSYFLRGDSDFYVLDKQAQLKRDIAVSARGIRPVCTLKHNTEVIEANDNCYKIKPYSTIQVFTDEDLLNLILNK